MNSKKEKEEEKKLPFVQIGHPNNISAFAALSLDHKPIFLLLWF